MESRIGILIDHLGVNQKEFAEQIGLTPGNITEWRKGRSAPTAKILKILAEKYSISLNWLLTGTGSMFLNAPPDTGIHCPNCGSKLKITIEKDSV